MLSRNTWYTKLTKDLGIFYLQGIDCRFRPLIVIRCDPIISSEISADDMKHTAAYFLDHIAKSLFLPGQVENWVVLVDLKDVSLMSVPYTVNEDLSDLKGSFRFHAK